MAGAYLLVCALVLAVAGTAPASGQAPGVTLSLSSTEYGAPTTGPLFGVYNVLDVQITVSNGTSSPTGALTVTDRLPVSGVYVDGSATCGSSAGCTVTPTSSGKTTILTFAIASVPASGSDVLGFQLHIRAGGLFHNLVNVARWSGAGCARKSCSSNRIAVPVIPSPVQIQASVTGSYIQYTLTVRNWTSSEQDGVVVTDAVPTGTQYVPGSATCDTSKAVIPTSCSGSESGGLLTYTISALPPRAPGKKPNQSPFVTLGFWAQATATSSTGAVPIVNSAAWTGDVCHFGPPCLSPSVTKSVVPVVVSSPVPPPVPTTTTTTPAPRESPAAPTSTTTTTTTTTTPAPVSSPAALRTVRPSLTLSPASIAPGGTTVVTGVGCPAYAAVAVSVDGTEVSRTTADQQGRFSLHVSPGTLPVGQHRVSAQCGSTVLSTTLDVVVTTSSSASPAVGAGAAAFGVFLLLGILLLRGQFDTNVTGKRRDKRDAQDVLASGQG